MSRNLKIDFKGASYDVNLYQPMAQKVQGINDCSHRESISAQTE